MVAKGFAVGAAIAGFPLVLTLVVGALMLSADDLEWSFGNRVTYVRVLAAVLAMDALVGAAVGVYAWLGAPPPASDRADPLRSTRQDRAASLVSAITAGLLASTRALAARPVEVLRTE